MTTDMEDASFSADGMRSKMHIRETSVAQRRLDYNAPLLSVRRLIDAGGEVRSKLWKLSAELSKEPLRVPGAVPFTWEHSPGRPKQPEAAEPPRASASPPQTSKSPPRSPSSPFPPSTPSPPSTRRASPASPPPRAAPLLHIPLLRSASSTMSSTPPPPPPPPPRGPAFMHVPERSTPRNNSTLPNPSPHPPPPAPPLPPAHISASTAPVRGKAFRIVDPTEDLLRALRARRDKLDASEAQAGLGRESLKTEDYICKQLTNEGPTGSCEVVDSIVQRFLADHPDASVELDDYREVQLHKQEDEEGICVTGKYDVAANASSVDAYPMWHHRRVHTEPNNDIPGKEEQAASRLSSDKAIGEEPKMQRQADSSACGEAHASERAKPRPPGLPPPVKVAPEAVDGSLRIPKQKSKRRTAPIVMLDSCRVDSMRIIRKSFVQMCRKAAVASLHSLAKARRSVTPLRCSSSSPKVVFHRPDIVPNGTSSNCHEVIVVRESEVRTEERLSQSAEQDLNSQLLPVSPPRTSTGVQVEEMELSEGIPATFPKYKTNVIMDITSSPTPDILVSRDANPEVQAIMDSTSATATSLDAPALDHDDLNKKENLHLHLSLQAEMFVPRPYSAHHVYAKSLGGDDLNEFFDASSRFGSQNSTPARSHLGRSMSRDWVQSDDFLDAFSTPFESPCTSVSERRYLSSPLIISKATSSKRPMSKLNKRVGKSLWLNTTEISLEKATAISGAQTRGFYSGELYSMSCAILNRDDEMGSSRRTWTSGDQASTSTSQSRRPNKRDVLSLHTSRTALNSIAVTPVFPSKCQKNRTIASASGLPRQILTEEMKDVGWPLGISGYPPLKKNAKGKAQSNAPDNEPKSSIFVPPPLLPPTPGGSWLRKAVTSTSLSHNPIRLGGLQAAVAGDPAKKTYSTTSNGTNKWEDVVKKQPC